MKGVALDFFPPALQFTLHPNRECMQAQNLSNKLEFSSVAWPHSLQPQSSRFSFPPFPARDAQRASYM